MIQEIPQQIMKIQQSDSDKHGKNVIAEKAQENNMCNTLASTMTQHINLS